MSNAFSLNLNGFVSPIFFEQDFHSALLGLFLAPGCRSAPEPGSLYPKPRTVTLRVALFNLPTGCERLSEICMTLFGLAPTPLRLCNLSVGVPSGTAEDGDAKHRNGLGTNFSAQGSAEISR